MNVLVVMFDTLRPDYIHFLGNEWIRTPHLDAFAAESCVFTQATAEFPITVPSRTAFLTGNYTFTNRPWCPLKPEDKPISEILQSQGYRTGAISYSPFNPWNGMTRGFDEFDWIDGGKITPPQVEFKMPDVSHIRIPPGISKQDLKYYLDFVVNRAYFMERDGYYIPDSATIRIKKWLDENKDKKFFLWADYFDPHEPWDPPEPYRSMYDTYTGKKLPMPTGPDTSYLSPEELQSIRAQYGGTVTQVDDEFGKLCDHLKALGLWDNTIVIVISDHGMPFGEHNQIRKFVVPVYDELARAVFMIRVPGVKPVASDALVQNTDMVPTLLSLLGIEVEHKMDGVDLTPIMRGEKRQVRERAYIGAFQVRAAIRTPEWKFIDNHGEKPNELFNMLDDPGEQVNLAEKEPQLASKLHRELFDWRMNWSGIADWKGDLWQGEDLTHYRPW